jgi:hypothetical protein
VVPDNVTPSGIVRLSRDDGATVDCGPIRWCRAIAPADSPPVADFLAVADTLFRSGDVLGVAGEPVTGVAAQIGVATM